MTSSLVKSKQIIGAHFSTLFSAIFLSLMLLNIQIDWIILKTYDQQFTLTTKKSLRIIFKAFQLQILSYDVDCGQLTSVIFHGLCCEFGLVLLTQNHTVYPVNVFIRAGTSCLSLPWRLSTVPVSLNFLNNLLMLLVVYPLSRNSVLNCLALYPLNWYNFFIIILCLSLKTMLTNHALTLWHQR